MATFIPLVPPAIVNVEALKAGRPASGRVAHAMASMPVHVLGVRALRTSTMVLQIGDWSGGNGDRNATSTRTHHLAVRPSPLARWAFVAVHYARKASASSSHIEIDLRKDSSLATPGQVVRWDDPPPTVPAGAKAAVLGLTPRPASAGLVAGRVGVLTTGWNPASGASGDVRPFNLASLAAEDLWLRVDWVGCLVTAVTLVEIAQSEVQ